MTGTVALTCGAARLEVCPDAGASVARYQTMVDGNQVHWLRPASAETLRQGDPLGMACFPLVPFSNRIRRGRFSFHGRQVTLPSNRSNMPHAIHGHGWQAAWAVSDRSPEAVTLEYVHAADAWPYPYRARQHFRLTDAALSITLEVENIGGEAMPAGLGLHPYFSRRDGARVATAVDRVWLTDDEVLPTELAPVPTDWRLSDGLDVDAVALDNGFTGWNGHARIDWPASGQALSIEADAAFRFMVIFTPPGADFFCVEPVSHCTDAVNMAAAGRNDTGMAVLSPGERLSGTVTFTPGP